MNEDISFQDDSLLNADSVEINKAITENAQLREINMQLNTNLKNLQAQFDEAVSVSGKMEELNKENLNLKQQLLKSREQIDDLNQRLQIIMQSTHDVNNTAKNSKAVSDREHQDEVDELKAQIYEIQNRGKVETDRVKMRLKNSEEMSMKIQTENAILKNQIGKIVNLSQNYFHQKFQDSGELIDFLMHPLPEIDKPIRTESNSEDKKRIKVIKEKLEREKARRKQLELEIIQLKKTIDVEASKKNEEKVDLQDLKRKYENEIKKLKSDHQREIVVLTKQIDLKGKRRNAGIQATPGYVSESNIGPISFEGFRESEDLKTKLRDTEVALSQLRTQTNAFQAQIDDDEQIKDKLHKKIQSLHSKLDQSQRDLKNAQRQVNSLSVQLDQIKGEKNGLEDKVHLLTAAGDDLQTKHTSANYELDAAKKALEYMEKLTKNQYSEISQLTHDRDHLLSLVHAQNQSLSNTEEIIRKLQSEIREKESLVPEYAHQDQDNNPSEWDFGTLPEDLKDIIREFATNDGMDINNKIKHIFNIVSKWFDNSNAEHEAQIMEMNKKVHNANRTIADFATSLLRAIEQDSLDLNEIVNAVSDLHKEKLTLEQRLNEINSVPVYFSQQTYNEMNDTISSLQQIAKELRNKEKQKKAELHECKSAFIDCQKKNQEQIDTLQLANEKAHETINELQQQLDDLHSQHKTLLNELTQIKDNQSSEYSQAQSDFEQYKMDFSSKLEDEKSEYIKQIQDREAQINNLSTKNNELNSSLRQWEEISRKSTDEARRLKKELNQVRLEKSEEISKIVAQKDQEVQQIEDHYQAMIEQLREKSNETEAIVKNMQNEFEENEKKMKEMTSQVTQLTFQLQKADLKAQSELDSVERSKKLIVAQLKTKLLAVETKYSVLAEEQKHNWENEKRALFGYLAQQFGAFYDIKQSLTDESFKQVVGRIKNEIERHKKQELTIRKLLHAKENQTTEDALADLVLSQHPKLQKKPGRY